jgi:hypothetical protein
MTLADQFASIGELLSRVDGNGAPPRRAAAARSTPAAASAAQKKNELAPTSVSAPVRSNDAASAATPSPEPALASATTTADEDDDLPRPGKVWSSGPSASLSTLMAQHRKTAAAPAPAPAPAPPPIASADANIEPIDPSDLAGVWRAFLALLMTQGPSLHSLLAQGRLVAIEDGNATLGFSPHHEAMVGMWERNGKKDTIRDALCKVLNQSISVKFRIDQQMPAPAPAPANGAANPVPSRRPQSAAAQAQAPAPAVVEAPSIRITPELVEAIRAQQPLVKEVMDRLGGQVIKVE